MSFLPLQTEITHIDDHNVLIDISGVRVTIPRSAIAGSPKTGEILQIVGIAAGKQQDTDQEVARAMLNQLLGEGATNA